MMHAPSSSQFSLSTSTRILLHKIVKYKLDSTDALAFVKFLVYLLRLEEALCRRLILRLASIW
jgi:hypothetical protein